MATLSGQEIQNIWQQWLQIGAGNVGLSASFQSVMDGAGNSSPLQLSNSAVKINATTITINGQTLTLTGPSSVSGTNTGDQTIILTGDITGSGTGTIATTLAANKTNTIIQTAFFQTNTTTTGTGTYSTAAAPTSSGGNAWMTKNITPTNSSNWLKIEVNVTAGTNNAGNGIIMALFNGTTLLASNIIGANSINPNPTGQLVYWMQAGTTSQITFNVRGGSNGAGTTGFCSTTTTQSATMGSSLYCNITITEYLASSIS